MENIISADLDAIAGEPAFDVVADFACRFPVTVAANTLGIPKADHERLYLACEGVGSFIEPPDGGHHPGDGTSLRGDDVLRC